MTREAFGQRATVAAVLVAATTARVVVIQVVEARGVEVAKMLVVAVSPGVGTLVVVASPLVPMATKE